MATKNESMIKVYIAGPYSDTNVLGVLRNIGRGEDIACQVFQLGFAPFVPWHDKSFVISSYRYDFSVDAFYKYSIEWLKVSDCMLVVPNVPGLKNWENSMGTRKEIETAKSLDKPVFYSITEMIKYYGK